MLPKNRIKFQEQNIEKLEKKKNEEKGLSNLNQKRLNNLKEQLEKDLGIISKFDSTLRNLKDNAVVTSWAGNPPKSDLAYIASLERQFNLVPSLMSQDYILAHQEVVALLDARRKKRKKPLKCKPGFVQRGAVCQPKKTKKKANLKTATFLTASTLAAAALLYKKSQKAKPSPYPVEIEKIAQKKGLKLNNASKAAIATVALGGIGASTYLATKKRYRDGLAESATMAEDRAANIQVGKVKQRQKTIVFGVGGAAYESISPTVRTGQRIIKASKLAFSRDKGKDFKGVPIDNSINNHLSPERGNRLERTRDLARLLWQRHTAGRSETAVNLAANVIAYADKYPDRRLVMIGQSMGGLDVHEAQEILKISRPELEGRLVSFAVGSFYGGFTKPFGEDYTLGSPNDLATTYLPTRNKVDFANVKGHSQGSYFLDEEVKQFVQDKIYSKIERLDARRKKRLKCKPGFVQRGAVCQPMRRRNKGKLLAVAATTAAAGITYAVARNQRQKAIEETIAKGKKEVVEVMAAYAKDHFKRETEVAEKEAQLNGQIGKLQADLAAINNRNTQAQQELDVANNRISRLEKAEQAGVQQVAKLSQELDEIVSSKNKTTEELVAAKTALSQAEEMIENVRTQKDNLSGMIQNLETQLSTNQTQKEQELTRLQSQLSELENQRTQLAQGLREQETKLEELDRQSATTLKTRLTDQQKQFEGQLQAKQQELEDEIARGADPKPKKGQSAKRGDLIATESGVAFGASHRWGSNFFNLSPPEQQTKLQNKVNQLLDKSYSDRLLGLQRDFTERVQSTTPKEKQPYPRLSELATTVNVKDKTLIKELKGQEKELLPRLVSLEKDVAQHNLREEVLEYVQQAAGEQLRQSYRELLENFQAFAVDEGGSYSSGAINNDLLKDFDSQSQSIVKNYNSNLDAAISKIISPKFAKQIQQILSEYIEEAPTEEIVMRKRKQVALKLSEKILADIFNLRAR